MLLGGLHPTSNFLEAVHFLRVVSHFFQPKTVTTRSRNLVYLKLYMRFPYNHMNSVVRTLRAKTLSTGNLTIIFQELQSQNDRITEK